MGKLLNVVTPLHKKSKRDYLARMLDDKVECMKVAERYGRDYWDTDRRFGYGGYKYDGRWEPAAKRLIKQYRLKKNAKILDVGCGKGFLLYEFKKLLPDCRIAGCDISDYALKQAKGQVRPYLFKQKAEGKYPFKKNAFDLVISITTLHNLYLYDLEKALVELERVAKNKYIVVESYRDEKELFNLQCWALTCKLFFSPGEWKWIFKKFGYSGDYEFIYFV